MTSARRDILKGGALVAAASFLPCRLVAAEGADGTDFDRAHAAMWATIENHFAKLGYRQRDPASIVTRDETFNGGLRYDDTGLLQKPGHMAFQQCARLEDIEKKHRRDVLPLFHIFSCSKPLGLKHPQTAAQVLAFLTETLALDPARLSFVGTARLNDYLPVLESAKVEPIRQVFLRDEDEALRTADGSGYFRFPGNPDAPLQATAGIYCWIGDGAPQRLDSYPPSENWTEIGEMSLDAEDSLAFGFGTERLTLAATGLIPSWQERLVQLFESIESGSSGAKPPSGRARFTDR